MRSSWLTRRGARNGAISRGFLLGGLTVLAVACAVGLVSLWYPESRDKVAAKVWALMGRQDSPEEHGHEDAGEEQRHTESAQAAADGPASHDAHERTTATSAADEFDHRHDEADTIKLSTQAQASIGVQLTRVELQPFERSVTLPGMVVERPGWSIMEVTAPMTGVVTRIYCVQGEATEPAQALFDLRLTHEDLLQVQTDYLRTVEELDVIRREIARLEKVAAEGAISGKSFLERQYDQQRQEALLRTLRQALLLHGLNDEQVDTIMRTRTLLQSLTIFAPEHKGEAAEPRSPGTLQVRQLHVAQGKFVNAGDTLCTLVNHEELYIEGQAFEQEIPAINCVAAEGRGVSVSLDAKGSGPVTLTDLKILYMDDLVDPLSRTFRFYVTLPNQLLREDKSPQGRRFVYWQFRPGQRSQISLPVERWENRIVLPIEAVADEGAESYVFEFNKDHFDRRPVHVEYRDERSAVIANDGTLRVGSQVASSAAHQMQLALKNKAGDTVDPHAEHDH